MTCLARNSRTLRPAVEAETGRTGAGDAPAAHSETLGAGPGMPVAAVEEVSAVADGAAG
jgi:hypothetical protein